MNNLSLLPSFNRRRGLWAAGALAFAGALAVGAQSASSPVAIKRDPQPVNRGPMESASFSSVVKRVGPSVVKITTNTKPRRVAQQLPPGFDNPMFRQFFGGRLPEMIQPGQAGLGSGVIISSDGYVVTNNHVVNGADEVMVSLDDGRELKAKVVGTDPQTDLAVIKIEAKNLPAVTFADSSSIEVGDRVLAIGNPFGLGETVTTGIVSAKGRRAGLGLEYEDFVQTDAAINPGNSGGALVDVQGRLIGINTAILSRTGGFQGVGLAVPANLVSQVTEGIVKNGKVVRGFIGVSTQDLTATLAESMELKSRRGALVSDVRPNGPAAKAGLKNGDVITAVNGKPVEDSTRLSLAVSAIAPGETIDLEVIREGEKRTLTAKAGERPKDLLSRDDRTPGREDFSGEDSGVLQGVAVDDIDAGNRRQLKLPASLHGALITQVAPDSAAARAGLRPGDVILEFNKQPVNDARELVELCAKSDSRKSLLRVWSRGSRTFVVVDETQSDAAGN